MFEVVQLSWFGAVGMASLTATISLFGTAFLGARLRRQRLASGRAPRAHQAAAEEVELGHVPLSYRSFADAALGEFTLARRRMLGGLPSGEFVAQDYGLCTCVLMAAFENDSCRALGFAAQLVKLPLEGERHRARRSAIISVARVLSGVVEEEDWEFLNAAPSFEPVMLWPCRYAVARLLQASGHREEVLTLIGSAPPWPETSHFARLHAELLQNFSGESPQQKAA